MAHPWAAGAGIGRDRRQPRRLRARWGAVSRRRSKSAGRPFPAWPQPTHASPYPTPTPRHVPSGLSSSHRTVPLPASLRGREGSRQRARRARPVGAALGAEGGSEEGPALPTLRDNPSWCRRLAVIFKISFPQSGEKSSFCLCLSPSSPRALGGVTGGGGLEDEGPGQCACGGVRLLRTLAPPSGADPPAGPPPPGQPLPGAPRPLTQQAF